MRIEQKLSIPLAIIAIGNILTIIFKNRPDHYYLIYVLPFVLLAIFFQFFPKKTNNKIISISLLVLSCIGVWFGDYTDLISITLFIFSLYIGKVNKKALYIYLGIIIVFIMARFTLTDLNVSQMSVFIAGASFILILYFHYIHPKPPVIEKIPGFTDDHMEILAGMIGGKKPKEIADEMCLSDSTIRNKQAEMREKLSVSTNEQLIYHLWGILKFKSPT